MLVIRTAIIRVGSSHTRMVVNIDLIGPGLGVKEVSGLVSRKGSFSKVWSDWGFWDILETRSTARATIGKVEVTRPRKR